MITVISPAKTLDFDTPSISKKHSQPQLLDHSEQLIDVLTTKSPHDLQKLMGISESLAELNSERYRQWSRPFNKKNAKTALLAFKGDVYIGLEPEGFEAEDFAFAQDHLRILSGLYGVLRPLDLIQPYRLEMGTKLQIDQAANLYKFWGDTLPAHINKAIKK
ncbi:MAG: peroxide stress protein YaaA, partial [Pseudomonadota bacterium]